jgi:hypothetical protein
MTKNLKVLIVEKLGSLKSLTIKDYNEEDLYKKCGFKNSNNFLKQTEWKIKYENNKYILSLFAKIEGKANTENKYDFPPPNDKLLFFGDCVIVCSVLNNEGNPIYTSLSIELWNIFYEKLFGGFENLNATAEEDENEEDELENIPSKFKTKQGYLKDGFVVEDKLLLDDEEEDDDSYETDDDEPLDDSIEEDDDLGDLENIGSELSVELYSDTSSDVGKN